MIDFVPSGVSRNGLAGLLLTVAAISSSTLRRWSGVVVWIAGLDPLVVGCCETGLVAFTGTDCWAMFSPGIGGMGTCFCGWATCCPNCAGWRPGADGCGGIVGSPCNTCGRCWPCIPAVDGLWADGRSCCCWLGLDWGCPCLLKDDVKMAMQKRIYWIVIYLWVELVALEADVAAVASLLELLRIGPQFTIPATKRRLIIVIDPVLSGQSTVNIWIKNWLLICRHKMDTL